MKNVTPSNDFEAFILKVGEDEYTEYIVDCKSSAAFVNGQLTKLRFDCMNLDSCRDDIISSGNKKYIVFIHYIGFFRTVEEAETWDPSYVKYRPDCLHDLDRLACLYNNLRFLAKTEFLH